MIIVMTLSKPAFFHTGDRRGYLPFPSKSAKKKYVTCDRKSSLTNLVCQRIIKDEAKKGNMLYAYLCKHCNGWHLTHVKQK